MRRRIDVSGRVQGVGFRWATRGEAERLGLSGSVRNLADGRVTVLAEGPPEAVDALTTWLASGPPLAQVAAVESEDLPAVDARAHAGRFEIL